MNLKHKLKRKLWSFRIIRFFTKFKPYEAIDPRNVIVDDDYNVVDFSNAILIYTCRYCGHELAYIRHCRRHDAKELKHCPECSSGIDWSELDEE